MTPNPAPNPAPTVTTPAVAPTAKRIDALDVLRGFALLGIILVNMPNFAYSWQYYRPLGYPGLSELDRQLEWFVRSFLQAAFYPLFSMLFGLGFALQLERFRARGAKVTVLFLRRLTVLLLIGALHASLVWTGDILISYALVGFTLLFFYRRSNRTLTLFIVAGLLFAYSGYARYVDLSPYNPISRAYIRTLPQVYAQGEWLEVTRLRIQDYAFIFFGSAFAKAHILAFFLTGLMIGRSGFFRRLRDYRGVLWLAFALGLLIGLATKLPRAYHLLTNAWPTQDATLYALSVVVGGPALGFAYASGLLLLFLTPAGERLLQPLAAVGRMALTNYLVQSLVAVTLFYGYGFGLYGMGLSRALMIALLIYALQIPFSNLWLRYFRYGPFEWLWRSLTYGQAQPFRKETP